jgi:hypothetical protein
LGGGAARVAAIEQWAEITPPDLGEIGGADYLLETPDVGLQIRVRPVNWSGADTVLHRVLVVSGVWVIGAADHCKHCPAGR